jgi:YebC/PmpR family DNA-binding regulatory protein
MSGHSKWKTNKGKKALADAKKGAAYTKIIKEITLAAREGGGNPDTNSKLRNMMLRAKELNMPSDNVKMAVKRGTGEIPGIIYEAVNYEGYGPGGVAVLIEEIRNIMNKKNGSLGGSVAWMFTTKGLINITKSTIGEDELMSLVLEAGAEDLKAEGDTYEVYSKPQDQEKVKAALVAKSIKWEEAETTMIPSSTIKLNVQDAKAILSLVESLEEHDDVQAVYCNFEIPDEIMDQISAEQE